MFGTFPAAQRPGAGQRPVTSTPSPPTRGARTKLGRRTARRGAAGNARRRLLAFAGLAILAIGFGFGLHKPAAAHNREKLSDPEDGVTLQKAPTQVTFRFKQPVDRDSLTMILIEPTGTRTPLKILRAQGDEAVGELPPLAEGTYNVRWKLISSDGHAVTNRITFTVAPAQPGSVPPTGPITSSSAADSPAVTTDEAGAPATGGAAAVTVGGSAPTVPGTTQTPAANSPTTTAAGQASIPTIVARVPQVAAPVADDPTAPSWVRWLLRFLSYLAIFLLVGTWSARQFLGAATLPDHRYLPLARVAAGVIVATAIAQLGVLAVDVDPQRPFSTARRLVGFDAGIGLLARTLIGCVVLFGISQKRGIAVRRRGLRGLLPSASLATSLLATWAYAGHAKSQRWPILGLPLDVAHHFAAAVWLGNLGAMFFFRPEPGLGRVYMRLIVRLSVVAFVSVAVVVVTGVLQSVRLAGFEALRLQTRHSALLVVKIGLVGIMLLFANANRRRVKRLARDASTIVALRRFIFLEFVIGIAVVALTSSLVVASPTALSEAGPSTRSVPLARCDGCAEPTANTAKTAKPPQTART